MSRLRRSIAIIAVLSGAMLTSACQQETPVARAAVDSLDRATANARQQRISNLAYDALIDIAANAKELSGVVTISFDLSDASSALTLDFTGGLVERAEINGVETEIAYNDYFITLPADPLIEDQNTVTITYRRPYGHDGTGLHRFVDPEDGRTYLHSYLWPYYANRLLPSFDQPSLKANFSLRVNAPQDWVVVSTSPGTAQPTGDDTHLWTFNATPKISTYMFSLHAGEYSVWQDNAGEIPLRLMARQSLAEYVAVDEWFELTRKGMEFYEDYFDIPYPFEKYDQLIVPEFNIGGMENAAAVTYTEDYVQRQPSSRSQRENRANTVLHELAHMWFGDLVTHRWWNGMWLNESFATQMATLALLETTEFTDMWHGFFTDSKKDAYARDSRVTTHPIEMPVASTDEFSVLFDDITYEKGGSALKQLRYRVGAENYRRGVSDYLKEFSFGITELADFIEYQGKTSGIDLHQWSDEWLLTTGYNTLTVDTVCEDDELRSIDIVQSTTGTDHTLRTHKTMLGLYNYDNDGNIAVTKTLSVEIKGKRTPVSIANGQPCPQLVNPNLSDWTYAQIAISNTEAEFLGDNLHKIQDPLSRSMFLAALYAKAMAGEVPVADYVRLALKLADTEQNVRVLQQIVKSMAEAIHVMQRLRPDTDDALPRLLDDIEQLALKRAHFDATHDLKLLWFDVFLNVASSDAAIGTARAILDGNAKVDGVEISSDIRWALLTILSRHDAADAAQRLADEIARDPSDLGQRNLLGARSAAPDLASKEKWVDELQSPETIANLSKQRAVMASLFPATQTDLQLQLLPKILSSLPQMSRDADAYFLSSYTETLLTPMCRPESNELMQSALYDFADQLNPTARRFLREAHQADVECQALRTAQ